MKYKISNVYIEVNGNSIAVGTVLGQEDNPSSPYRTDIITNTEYERGLKAFEYGNQVIGDMVYHCVGKFVNYKAKSPIDKKWIDELKKQGYEVSKLEYEVVS